MRRSHFGSGKNTPSAIKPALGQVSENGSKVSASKEPWNVLQQRPLGSNHAQAFDCGGPAVALVCGSLSLPRQAERLAGEACRNEITAALVEFCVSVAYKVSDVSLKDGESLKHTVSLALLKYSTAVFVTLHRPDNTMAQQYRTQYPPTRTGEQA